MSRWRAVSSVRWWLVPAWPVKVPRCRRWSSSRRLRQVSAVWFSAIRISSSASQHSWHVGADAVFLAVVDGAQVERGLHVAPGALDSSSCL